MLAWRLTLRLLISEEGHYASDSDTGKGIALTARFLGKDQQAINRLELYRRPDLIHDEFGISLKKGNMPLGLGKRSTCIQ